MSKALPFFLLSLTLAHGAEKVGYNSDVRPILSDKCFLCHGPDKKNNKGDLRLDDEVAAYAALKDSPDKHAIVPGSLEKSVSWQRIIATDPDEIMPPSDSNLALSESEKKIIAQWIEQGANYEPHWAFVNLPESIEVPEIANPDWARNPIDQFVAAKLDKEGLKPSPEVDPVRWLRRATFAVTGLPPTLAQISTFEAELRTDQETAYEKAVDRLLSSRAYAATPTPGDTTPMSTSPPGPTATTSFAPTRPTCLTTNSSPKTSPATSFPTPPATKNSPPPPIALTA